jgi:hypothetical protein
MLSRVALVKTYVSEELSASFIRVTRIREVGTALAVPNSPTKAAKKYPDKGGAKFLRIVGSYKSHMA